MTKKQGVKIQSTEVVAVKNGQKVAKSAKKKKKWTKEGKKGKKVQHHLWKLPERVVLIVFFDKNNHI